MNDGHSGFRQDFARNACVKPRRRREARATGTPPALRPRIEQRRAFQATEPTWRAESSRGSARRTHRAKERHGYRRLKSGLAWTGRVGNQRSQCSIGIFCRHADHKRRSHLGRYAEVHKPDLAPAQRCHSDCSRRSSSTKRRSAAATRSSSCGASCGDRATRRASSTTSSDRSVSGNASDSSRSFLVAWVTKSPSHVVGSGSSA